MERFLISWGWLGILTNHGALIFFAGPLVLGLIAAFFDT